MVSVDVRGLAPGTRETDLCRPGTLVERAQAILLTGGSAFGLNAAAGVMRFLWERQLGFDVGGIRVPIVPGAVIFDLALGEIAWPGEDMGYQACAAAAGGEVAQGCIGAGTGASVGHALGVQRATKSGLGTSSVRTDDGVVVGALVVVNAYGDVIRPGSDTILAGTRDAQGRFVNTEGLVRADKQSARLHTSTTIGVVATDATLSSDHVQHLAVVAHDGLARTIRPVHTLMDGDALFALSTQRRDGGRRALLGLASATVEAVERAVIKAVTLATPAGGLPAASS